jgi:stromal membrane-associated protein
MWTSKLGAKFPRGDIERLDSQHHQELKRLRSLPANYLCAECQEPGTCWASVSLGVFVCVRCSDVHRAMGTHISKVKGCTGTYLWGPDEIAQMRELGNGEAVRLYGSAPVPAADASKDERLRLCRQKYEERRWAGAPAPAERSRAAASPSRQPPRAQRTVHAASAEPEVAVPRRAQQAQLELDIDAIFAALHGDVQGVGAAPCGATKLAPAAEQPLVDFLDHCLAVPRVHQKHSPPQPAPDFWANFREW